MLIIDRFEGDIAVCTDDNKNLVNLNKSQLPKGAAAGDSLYIKDGQYFIDSDETLKRKKRIEDLMEDLFE